MASPALAVALAGAGIDDAQTALLAMNAQRLEHLLLVGQEGQACGGEGIPVETEVGADHDVGSLVEGVREPAAADLRSLATKSAFADRARIFGTGPGP
jgi:hypothetical protein